MCGSLHVRTSTQQGRLKQFRSGTAMGVVIRSRTLIASEASFLVCSMRGFSIYMFIYTVDREIFVFFLIFRALKFHGAKFS